VTEKPELMLEGTVDVMQAIWTFSNLDNQPMGSFLANQPYDPSKAHDPRYILTFDLCRKAYARVVVDSIQNPLLDLADLFNYPWADYKAAGFDCIWISHQDWSPLTGEEVEQLEADVTNDLLFDYRENEIDIWFDDSTDPCYLYVGVQDREDEEDISKRASFYL
jgi:hypothetical protein